MRKRDRLLKKRAKMRIKDAKKLSRLIKQREKWSKSPVLFKLGKYMLNVSLMLTVKAADYQLRRIKWRYQK
ncbi:Protein of unknown function [Lactobacillus hominis DSM 23910 = CRBIP 24.179]|uniref:Uncharacterized protein n=1 Tax=Lactobacillus hominis DSM 23910 = CRBIP 24.179 TaxID=1423758 RepID=I7KHD2_9LACO|nr:hypothetical protein [Lactobacillus hominis]CCI82010.1 Protein of unknown function [Lactobacillus hominis DSM 23910 = CRBIP 24.179]